MAKLKLVWTQTALKQRNQVFQYWNKRNKSIEYSKRLRTQISERIEFLKTYPNIGIQTDFENIKSLPLGHFSILYSQIDNSIYIIGFWDNRNDPDKLLEFLKKN